MLRSRLLPLLCVQVLLASPASAHIRLQVPQSRYTDRESGDGGFCPCGVVTGGRRCRLPAERSDPNRSDERATALPGGSTLRVRLEEYVGHAGRLRVAFDPDGAELDDFDAHVLTDIPDPEGNTGNSGEGSFWEIEVQLPNIDCERCTLQVFQRVDGDQQSPVLSPDETGYFACADLLLTRDPSLPEGYAEPRIVLEQPASSEPGGASAGAAAGTEPSATSSPPSPESSAGACSLHAQGQAQGAGVLALAAWVLCARRRLRRC